MPLVLAALLMCVPCRAQTYFVDAAFGDDGASGRSWGEAFATVQRALEEARLAAASGSRPRVNVAAGIYTIGSVETVDFPVVLVGAYPSGGGPRDRGSNETILQHVGLRFELGSNTSILDGFSAAGGATGIFLQDGVTVRNCAVRGGGVGISARAGRITRNEVSLNVNAGIKGRTPGDSPRFKDCSGRILIERNWVHDNQAKGIEAQDLNCGLDGEHPVLTVRHNRIQDTQPRQPAFDAGLLVSCCPVVYNNEIEGSQGAGVLIWSGYDENRPPTWVSPMLANLTVAGSSRVAIDFMESGGDLNLTRTILWDNAGGDVENMPSVTDVSYTLSQAPLPGTGNLDGVDPLLLNGPTGSSYLSQVAAGQAQDSPALDAGGVAVQDARLENRTTRIDGVRDQGMADMGFHPEPASFTVFRGTDPQALPLHLPDVNFPVWDRDAASGGTPSLLFYEADSDEWILLRRAGPDVEIRWEYQQFDE
jgi:hypothetical protein